MLFIPLMRCRLLLVGPFWGGGEGALEWFGGGGRKWCVVNGPSWRCRTWELYELVSWEVGLRGYLQEGGGE